MDDRTSSGQWLDLGNRRTCDHFEFALDAEAQSRGIRRGPDNPRERQKSHRLSHDAVGELRDGNVDRGSGLRAESRVADVPDNAYNPARRLGRELRPQPPPDQKTVGEWISIRPESQRPSPD